MGDYNVQEKVNNTNKSSNNKEAGTVQLKQNNNMSDIIQRAKINPNTMTQNDAMVLQRKIGNGGLMQLFKEQGKMQEDTMEENHEKLEDQGPLQMKKNDAIQSAEMPENKTGMPDNLKAGVENLSGLDMSDVRVHYNSDKPAKVGALAYTQGAEIHVGPGQEKHLAHEAWHVVQQKQGRVNPTMQLKGIAVNNDRGLEYEADIMGKKSIQSKQVKRYNSELVNKVNFDRLIQRNVSIKEPYREYDDLEKLLKIIISSIGMFKGEKCFDNLIDNKGYVEETVKELFERDSKYEKMKDFTDEFVQTFSLKFDYDPQKFSKEKWAVLHRMESKSFSRFVQALTGKSSVDNSEYESTYSRYNPHKFGKKHTWKGNTGWLAYVINHFAKLVVTDIPIKTNNIFRTKKNTYSEANPGEKDYDTFSAYAREIAALLYENYLPISKKTISSSETKTDVVTMVKQDNLPTIAKKAILEKVKVNKDIALWIIKGNAKLGVGKELKEREREKKALSFYSNACIPTLFPEKEISEPYTTETKETYRPMRWVSRDYRPRSAKSIELEKVRENRKKEKIRIAKIHEKKDLNTYILKREDLLGLIKREANIISVFNMKSGNIFSLAQKSGFINEEMTITQFRKFIRENKNAIWKVKEVKPEKNV